MSFFPTGFDPRAPHVYVLDLCEIDTTEGIFRFWIGQDGAFVDSLSRTWYGSSLAQVSGLQSALNGAAPAGEVSLSYFQDPDAPDLQAELRGNGLTAIEGREIRFFVQPCNRLEDVYRPATPPLRWLTRVMRKLTFSSAGAQDRRIAVSFEPWTEGRRVSRPIPINTDGHAQLIGEANVSLSQIPTLDWETEKLF